MSEGTRLPLVISALAERLRETLGERLVGMYLGGSFSMGDFVEGVSDYDVLVLVADPLQVADLTALATMHEQLLRDHRDAERLADEDTLRRGIDALRTLLLPPTEAHDDDPS